VRRASKKLRNSAPACGSRRIRRTKSWPDTTARSGSFSDAAQHWKCGGFWPPHGWSHFDRRSRTSWHGQCADAGTWLAPHHWHFGKGRREPRWETWMSSASAGISPSLRVGRTGVRRATQAHSRVQWTGSGTSVRTSISFAEGIALFRCSFCGRHRVFLRSRVLADARCRRQRTRRPKTRLHGPFGSGSAFEPSSSSASLTSPSIASRSTRSRVRWAYSGDSCSSSMPRGPAGAVVRRPPNLKTDASAESWRGSQRTIRVEPSRLETKPRVTMSLLRTRI